ncbi:hypothetical protein NDU88_004989 [Pleurodeles waltl]|uniref:Uncharacterized protein n=1 Tax=Pleurodeles waltl TaxID=8319 RepID=A0AAV7T9B6_PLEWA|nr:hypothetical protein NDU88_004989 [Pleurodeles waltl]
MLEPMPAQNPHYEPLLPRLAHYYAARASPQRGLGYTRYWKNVVATTLGQPYSGGDLFEDFRAVVKLTRRHFLLHRGVAEVIRKHWHTDLWNFGPTAAAVA